MSLARFRAFTSLLIILVVSGCGSSTSAQAPAASTAATPAQPAQASTTAAAQPAEEVKLTLAAYSTPREAYEEIIPLFQQTPAGAGIIFDQSYGASGEQSRAVEAGLAADIVALSLEPDVTRLIGPGVVAEDWNKDDFNGMVTDSVVVFVVRPGNPKNVKTWGDLTKDGIEVLTPNPITSGGARWNVMAAYGAQLKLGKDHDQAVEYLRALFANVVVQDKSARESLQTFLGGKGDVLLGYENEAITAQQKEQTIDYVVPDQTILIENPVAIVKAIEHPEQARAFVDYLRSPEAQRVFGKKGYRPILKDVLAEFTYPAPATLFTIADFGGWADVQSTFFHAEDGIMTNINRDLGVE